MLTSTTSHKKEPLLPTLEVFGRLGLLDLDINLHHLIEAGVPVDDVAGAVGGETVSACTSSRADGATSSIARRSSTLTWASIDRQVGIARRLGVATLRLFFGRLARDAYTAVHLDTIGGHLQGLSARYPDMLFVFENHDGASLVPEICRAVLERADRQEHPDEFRSRSTSNAPASAARGALAVVRPWIAHVHLKGLAAGEYCEFGTGDVDLTPLLRSLVEQGYRGAFTVRIRGAIRRHAAAVRERAASASGIKN